MSKEAKDLAKAIRMLSQGSVMMSATVVSVDKNNNCCDVDVDGDEFGQIQLQALVKEDMKGCKMYPAEGSKVIIQKINEEGGWMVCLYSEIDEVINEIGESVYSINADGHTIKKGDDNLKQALKLMLESNMATMILYGNNENFVKLQQALVIIENVLQ